MSPSLQLAVSIPADLPGQTPAQFPGLPEFFLCAGTITRGCFVLFLPKEMNSILRSLLGAVRETVCKMSGSVLLFSGKARELLLTILQTNLSKMKASNYLYKVMEKKISSNSHF